MLHLLPIRILLFALLGVFAMALLGLTYAGMLGSGDRVTDLIVTMRWASLISLGATVVAFPLWRWVPWLQTLTIPYLGGHWTGEVRFDNGTKSRNVTLEANHSVFNIKLLLDSLESSSTTLVVHAERDPDFKRHRLYYVYRNERKEGFENSGQRYRGLAIISVVQGSPARLEGSYFTEGNRSGTLHLSLVKHHPWWAVWR